MWGRLALFGAATALALAGCHKDSSSTSGGTAAPTSEAVTITQASPPPGGTWADVVNATSDGFMMGNPDAKVKLVEIASLGCPFCKKFDEEGAPHLVDYVKRGQTSWEFRPYVIHGPIDMAANLVVSCNGAKTFFPLMLALYEDQDVWMGRVQAAPQDKLEQMQNLPTDQVFGAFANLAGLQEWAAARGVPQARSNQCLGDQKMIDHQVQVTANVTNQYPDFKGTPSFVLNGQLLSSTDTWEKLKPQLEAALK